MANLWSWSRLSAFDVLPPLYDNIFAQALAEHIARDHPLETPTAASGGIADKVSITICHDPGALNELSLFKLGHNAVAIFEDGSELRVNRLLVNEYYNKEEAAAGA